MKKRKRRGLSKAPTYRGNGKFSIMAGGCMIPEEMNDEDRMVEAGLRRKYGEILGDFDMCVGTNMGKRMWVITLPDGMEFDTYEGPHALEGELKRGLSDGEG